MKKTILIVEDNPDNSLLAKKVLSHYGFEIILCEDGSSALSYCQKSSPPSLILMDISIPDINGLDLTKKIRKLPSYLNVPIVAVTANATTEMQEKTLLAGCVNILLKPFTPSELIKIVEQYIGFSQ